MSHSQFHCTGRVYLDLHGLIFETSICYWQDQPGSPCGVVCAARAAAAAAPPPWWWVGGWARVGRSGPLERAWTGGRRRGTRPRASPGLSATSPLVSARSADSPRRPGSAAGRGGVSFGSLRVLECPRARGDSLSDFEKKCLPEFFYPTPRAPPSRKRGTTGGVGSVEGRLGQTGPLRFTPKRHGRGEASLSGATEANSRCAGTVHVDFEKNQAGALQWRVT